MKVPFSSLKEYLDINLSTEKIAEILTLAGIEVEAIETIGSDFTGVVTAKILSTTQHPNADRLKIARVFDGTEELQIVCGAKNCREGLVTALAKIGATLPPDESGKPFKIKKGKLRDIESFGMLCGADELGLAKEGDGIMELAEHTELGKDLSCLYADSIFDISLTPNLGHCLSVYGLARELSALLDIPLKSLDTKVHQTGVDIHSQLSVEIDDKDLCPRYMARICHEVQVAPSPDWLKRKIEAFGLKSINNAVDISNYVMLITGQPLHMFDYDKIEGKSLTVKKEQSSQSITTLDGIQRQVPNGSVVIYDKHRPQALGGVMGGQSSAITESTRSILIEAAIFSAKAIRKTSKELSLKTDASYRFERGVDPLGLQRALDMAAQMLHEIALACICEGMIDINPSPFIPKKVICRTERVQTLLGVEISQREIASLFERLGIRIAKEHLDTLEVIIPSFRNDLSLEIDLIEEIARLYGYNRIPRRKPLHVSSTMSDAPLYTFENLIRDRLISEGLQEMITCDLISPAMSEITKEPTQKDLHSLSVMQSKSNDYSVLRSSLLAGLLCSIKHNISHQIENISCFEIGRVHFKQKETVEELTCVAIALTGASRPHHHAPKGSEVDFFDMKGIIENLLSALKIEDVKYQPSHLHNFQPGRQATIECKGASIGVIGQLHPAKVSAMDITQKVYYAELNLHELITLSNREIKIKSLAQFPGSERDWTITVTKQTPIAHLLAAVYEQKTPLLETVFMLDLFESEKLGHDKKNVTLRFCYRDSTKTLSYEAVEAEHASLMTKVSEKLHGCILQ